MRKPTFGDVRRNRHLVDELGDLRAEIKPLKARETKLRLAILEGECSLVGDEYVATIATHTRETVDIDALRKFLGKRQAEQFMIKRKTVFLRVMSKEDRIAQERRKASRSARRREKE